MYYVLKSNHELPILLRNAVTWNMYTNKTFRPAMAALEDVYSVPTTIKRISAVHVQV
jgi:hypothetical protein